MSLLALSMIPLNSKKSHQICLKMSTRAFFHYIILYILLYLQSELDLNCKLK